jgi:glutathione S-transferase
MSRTTLTLSSKNYSSWSLRGWLLARFAGLEFDEVMLPADDADAKAEMLLLAPSILVPCLRHQGVTVWDTLAIAEYLHEIRPKAGLLPADRAARAHCRAICGEMHSGFVSLRSALPMNLKGHYPGYKVWNRAQGDIDRVLAIWKECLATHGGPFLFGAQRGMADAMYAPVVTRLRTYDVRVVDPASAAWCQRIIAMPEMQEWTAAAQAEPEAIDELDMEF